ncbi:MAG TPA: TraB/GumN family protein [archaeon]|nr:TraB/GumN family protein [archaeon]
MTVERIFLPEKEVILIGTAHISKVSVDLVREVIEKENPDAIGVELDSQRYYQLKYGKKWEETNIGDVISSGKAYLFLINLLLSNMQRKLGSELGVKPGSEMLEAIHLAREKGTSVALLDRNVAITMKRAMNLMSFTEKIKIAGSILFGIFAEKEELTPEKIEELKKEDIMSKLMKELSDTAPTISKVLVDERDQYIANKILYTQGKKIVAVLGAGHLHGVKKYLNEKIDLTPLETIPVKKSKLKYLAYFFPLIFIGLLAYAVLIKGITASISILAAWFLINGALSALGVVIARGHIASVLTAFIAAPFTSLHPALAAGWFAAYTEAKFNSPKVKDFESLGNLNSYRDFASNKFTRILLIATFANIGSTLGTLIALPYIASMLG